MGRKVHASYRLLLFSLCFTRSFACNFLFDVGTVIRTIFRTMSSKREAEAFKRNVLCDDLLHNSINTTRDSNRSFSPTFICSRCHCYVLLVLLLLLLLLLLDILLLATRRYLAFSRWQQA